jgi:hypothetical protein
VADDGALMIGTRMDVSAERNFFLQSVDPASGLAVAEVCCGRWPVATVAERMEADVRDFDPGNAHILDDATFSRAKQFFEVEFDVGENDACLCSWSEADGLPYRLHSGRELILMRSGRKPLTVLSGGIPADKNFEEIPEYLFDPLVESGRLVKTQFCSLNPARHGVYKGIRFVLYALKEEAWRMDAYILLQNVAQRSGWNEALTRLEGSLLGYSEWENDAYAASVRAHKERANKS